MARLYGQVCPVARSLDLLGERWTLLVVRDLLRGRGRFQQLLESSPGIAPNVLSDRLKLLEGHGIVTRRFYSDHPPRAEYVLTERGRELGMVVGALATWGARHAGAPETPTPTHVACGHAVDMAYRCPHCDTDVPRSAVELRRPDGPPDPEPGSPAEAATS